MSTGSSADLAMALIRVVEPKSLTVGQCNGVLNALEYVRADAPEVYRRITAVEPFRSKLHAQLDRLFYDRSGQCRGQLGLDGSQFVPTS